MSSHPKFTYRQAAAVGFDLGTSPHGLSVDLHRPDQETRRRSSLHFPASGLKRSDASAESAVFPPLTAQAASCSPSSEPAAPTGCAGKPQVYRTPQVREASRCLRVRAALLTPSGLHHMSFTDQEFLHLQSAVDRCRSKTRKAIGKGIAEVGDLRATDSLWEKLQDVMWARQTWRRQS